MFWNEDWFTRQCVSIAYTNLTMSNEYEWSLWIDNEMIMSDDWVKRKGNELTNDTMRWQQWERNEQMNETRNKRNEMRVRSVITKWVQTN